MVIVITLRLPLAYLVAGTLLGFGNAGCRVARNALLLHLVPNEVMGRVGGFYHVLDRVLRTVLVLAVGIISVYGPPAGFTLLAIMLVFALFGVWQSRTALPTRAVAVA
jgi:MFS-type transporter involved in bile tolerance (Atg22 family)